MEHKPGLTVQNKLKSYHEVLPTLVALAIIGGDQEIETESIKLIIRSFSQRSELRRNLHQLYLLYGEEGLASYRKIAEIVANLDETKKRFKDFLTGV